MFAKFQNIRILLVAVLFASAVPLLPQPAMGQFLDDEFDRDDFIESEQGFTEDTGFGVPGLTEDVTEGGQYVDEDPTGAVGGVTIRGRRTQLRVEQEKQMLPLNVAWGAGTGLLLGGWFALIDEGDDRSTQRSIGLGAVLGALLGMTVGLKTVIAPDAPRAAFLGTEPSQKILSLASESLPSPPPFSLGFTLKF